MRTKFAFLISFCGVAGVGIAMGGGGQPQAPQPVAPAITNVRVQEPIKNASNPEEKAVIAGVETFAKLYSAANVKQLADLFLDDASIIDPDENETRGKSAIAEMYTVAFKEAQGLKVTAEVEEVRFLTPDVARVNGQSQVASSTGDAAEFTEFNILLVKRNNRWMIAEIREHAAPAAEVSPYDRLRDLEWMVGEWVDESGSNRIHSNVRWADNQSYLVRTYQAEIQGEKKTSGTVFVGWDPQSGQIKSWVFDSHGGHGEAFWTRTGEKEWVVKAQGVLLDGRPTSATQVHTIINKDSVRTSSVDRIIGGQVAPDILDVVMVRKAPAPGAANPAPGTPRATSGVAKPAAKPATPR